MNSCYVLTILGLQLRYFLPAYIQLWNYTSVLDLERTLELRTSNFPNLKVRFMKLNFEPFEFHKFELVPRLNFLLCLQVLLLEYLCDACYQKVDIHKYWKNFLLLANSFRRPKAPAFLFLSPLESTWENLQSIIPNMLQLSVVGYPFVNPGAVGGVGHFKNR